MVLASHRNRNSGAAAPPPRLVLFDLILLNLLSILILCQTFCVSFSASSLPHRTGPGSAIGVEDRSYIIPMARFINCSASVFRKRFYFDLGCVVCEYNFLSARNLILNQYLTLRLECWMVPEELSVQVRRHLRLGSQTQYISSVLLLSLSLSQPLPLRFCLYLCLIVGLCPLCLCLCAASLFLFLCL